MDRRNFLRTGMAGTLVSPFVGRTFWQEGAVRTGSVRLDANENALGLSPRVREAIPGCLTEANRYPLALEQPLIDDLARRHGVRAESVVLGNGSSEILQMAAQALVASPARVVVADPTFEILEGYADSAGLEVVKAPLTADYAHDLDLMRRLAEGAPGGALVYLCNPNNPTGTLTSCRRIEDWIRDASDKTVFLVDEAYFDYVTSDRYWSMLKWVPRSPNLVVTRTFSKIYGMAGLRIGYGLARPETAERLRSFAADVNINHIALVAARIALEDTDYYEDSLSACREGRQLLLETCEELDIEVIPSHSNFVMHRVRGDLQRYIERMRTSGVRVGRPFPPLLSFNRVSIGLPEEMRIWANRLKEFRSRGWV